MKPAKSGPYGASVPTRLIHPNDLPVVERVLSAYLVYLRGGVPSSDQRDTSIAVIQRVLQRLRQMLDAPESLEGLPIFFTMQELQVINEAFLGFMRQLRLLVLPSVQRDEVISGLQALQQQFAAMLAVARH
jgi:hypothetical protein